MYHSIDILSLSIKYFNPECKTKNCYNTES